MISASATSDMANCAIVPANMLHQLKLLRMLVLDLPTGYHVSYSTSGQISLVSDSAPNGVAGDYNDNGVVDAADYVLWRKGVAPLQHEIAAPIGTTNSADYDAWRARFGSVSGSGSGGIGNAGAVPEPTTLAFVGMLLSVAMLGNRKRGG